MKSISNKAYFLNDDDFIFSSCNHFSTCFIMSYMLLHQVSISELEGKTIGLYFSIHSFRGSAGFTEKLSEVYKELQERGESFEVVRIPLDDDEESFNEGLKHIPWLSLPFKDKTSSKLIKYFELETLPTLVIIGPNGKTLQSNVAELVEEHGDQAYPFTSEKLEELAAIEKARLEAQTLESLLVSGNLDFVIGKNGVKVRKQTF